MACVTKRWIAAAASLLGASLANADTSTPAHGQTWQPSPGDVIAFDVLRQGNKFGTHIVRFDTDGGGDLSVVVDVDLKAGLGPITLFRYQLDATETWRDGQLVGLEGRVNDDGTRERVSALIEDGSLTVKGDGYDGTVALDILPASHWNVAQTLVDQLLSSENGELIDVVVEPLGRETIEAGGEQLDANKFMMDSDIDVTLWYGDDGRWLKLAFEARGQAIEYVLRDLY
ncbi:MAG: DUF6134 family protein [Pseudomonadota bacterium]